MPLTPEQLRNLIGVMENACAMPLVPSRPLVELTNTLNLLECGDGLDDLDESLEALVDAAVDVSGEWSFWPPDEYGSRLALVDSRAVEAMQAALAKYRETQPCP